MAPASASSHRASKKSLEPGWNTERIMHGSGDVDNHKQVFIVHIVPFSSTYSFTCTSSPLSSMISLLLHHFFTSTLSIFPASPTLHSLLSYVKLCLLLFFLHIILHLSLQNFFLYFLFYRLTFEYLPLCATFPSSTTSYSLLSLPPFPLPPPSLHYHRDST